MTAWKAYADATCHPGERRGRWGAVIVSPAGEVREVSAPIPAAWAFDTNTAELFAMFGAAMMVPPGSRVRLATDSAAARHVMAKGQRGWWCDGLADHFGTVIQARGLSLRYRCMSRGWHPYMRRADELSRGRLAA